MTTPSTESSLDAIERRYAAIYPLAQITRIALRFCATLIVIGATVLLMAYGLALAMAAAGASEADDVQAVVLAGVLFAAHLCVYIAYFSMLNLVHRMWRLAAVLWALGAAMLLIMVIPRIPDTLNSVMAPPAVSELPAAVRGLLACGLIAIIAYWAWLLPITLLRGAFALILASDEQRAAMRETPSGQSRLRAALSGLLGLPPLFHFVRDSRTRYARVVALTALSGLFLASAAIGTATMPQLLVHAYAESAQFFTNFLWPLVALPLGLGGLVFVLATIGREVEHAEFRQVRFSLEELQKVDLRPPILFLRAFKDDQVELPRPRLVHLARALDFGRRKANLDEMLLVEMTSYGPLVALGNPADPNPPYGAARQYFHNLSWRQAVEDLVLKSSIVVICVDSTDGVWWEVEHLTATRQFSKTLFLMHPSHRAASTNQALLTKLAAAMGMDGALAAKLLAKQKQSVLAFHMDSEGELHILRSSSFSQFAYLLASRIFVRDNLGMPNGSDVSQPRSG